MANRDVTLRLKVEGDATGSKRALQETADQMKVLDRVAKESANNVSQAFDKAGKDVGKSLGTSINDLTDKLDKLSSTVMNVGVAFAGFGAALSLPIAGAVQQAAGLEQAMAKVKATAEPTAAEFLKLQEHARNMGMTSVFSAKETAGAMLEISRAGYKTEETISSVNTVMQLAAVEEQAMGETAERLINILKGYNLEASQAARVGDVLARTSNDTTTSMALLASGFKMVGTLAAGTGMSVERTAAMLGVLSDRGVKGEEAGAGLRRVLAELSSPSQTARFALHDLGIEVARTAEGNVDMMQTVRNMGAAHLTTADAIRIFGVQGSREAAILAQNIDAIDKLNKRNEEADGTLKKMVDTTNAGLLPALTMAKNAVMGLGETLGSPLLAPLRVVVSAFTSVIQMVNSVAKAFPNITGAIGAVVGIIGIAAVAFGSLALAVGGMIYGVSALARGWQLLVAVKKDGIVTTLKSAAGIQAETKAIQADTAALERNVQARQRVGASVAPGVTTTGPIVDGSKNLGVKQAAAAGATGLATGILGGMAGEATASAVSSNENVKNFGFLIGNVLGGIAGTAFASTILTKLSTLGTGLGSVISGAMTAVAGSVAGAAALIAGAASAPLLATMAILSPKIAADHAKVKQMLTETKADLEELGKGRTLRGPIYGSKGVYGGLEATSAGQSFKSSGAEATDTELALVKAEAAALRDRRLAREGDRKELEKVGKEYLTIGQVKTDDRTLEEQIASVKSRYEVEVKLIESTTKQRSDSLKNEQELVKGNVAGAIASEQQRVAALQQIENEYSAQRITLAQETYTQTISARRSEYEETKKLLEIQRADKSNVEKQKEATTKLVELDKSYTEQSIAAQQKLTEAVNSEIDKQLQKRTEYMAKVVSIEQQIRDAQKATADAIRTVNETAGSSYEKLTLKIDDARKKTAEAVALSTAFPEKAMEFAKQAQSAWASMAQSVDATRMAIRNAALATRDAKIDLMKSDPTLTQVEKYQIAVQQLQNTIDEAKRLEKEGRRDEAIAAYKSAQDAVKGLASEAPEGMAQAVIAQGVALIDAMGAKQQELLQAKLADEEKINAEARANIEKMGNLITSTLQAQINQTQSLIAALNTNTAALQGKIQQVREEKGAPVTPGQTPPATSPTVEQIKQSTGDSVVREQARAAAEAAKTKEAAVTKAASTEALRLIAQGGTQDPRSVSARQIMSPEYQDEWRRANSPNSAKMLKYDYEAQQRMAEDPEKEKRRLLKAAYTAAGKEGDYYTSKQSERKAAADDAAYKERNLEQAKVRLKYTNVESVGPTDEEARAAYKENLYKTVGERARIADALTTPQKAEDPTKRMFQAAESIATAGSTFKENLDRAIEVAVTVNGTSISGQVTRR